MLLDLLPEDAQRKARQDGGRRRRKKQTGAYALQFEQIQDGDGGGGGGTHVEVATAAAAVHMVPAAANDTGVGSSGGGDSIDDWLAYADNLPPEDFLVEDLFEMSDTDDDDGLADDSEEEEEEEVPDGYVSGSESGDEDEEDEEEVGKETVQQEWAAGNTKSRQPPGTAAAAEAAGAAMLAAHQLPGQQQQQPSQQQATLPGAGSSCSGIASPPAGARAAALPPPSAEGGPSALATVAVLAPLGESTLGESSGGGGSPGKGMTPEGMAPVCRRTRARVNLSGMSLEQLEALLVDTDDEDEAGAAAREQDAEYMRFLQAIRGDWPGEGGGGGDAGEGGSSCGWPFGDEDDDDDFSVDLDELLADMPSDDEVLSPHPRQVGSGQAPITRAKRRRIDRSVPRPLESTKRLKQGALKPLLPRGSVPGTPGVGMGAWGGVTVPRDVLLQSGAMWASPQPFTADQLGQLHAQIHQHTQLMVQVHALAASTPCQHCVTRATRAMLQQLCTFRESQAAARSARGLPPWDAATLKWHDPSATAPAGSAEEGQQQQPWAPQQPASGSPLSVTSVAPLDLVPSFLREVDAAVPPLAAMPPVPLASGGHAPPAIVGAGAAGHALHDAGAGGAYGVGAAGQPGSGAHCSNGGGKCVGQPGGQLVGHGAAPDSAGGGDISSVLDGNHAGRGLVLLPGVWEVLLEFEELLDPSLLPKPDASLRNALWLPSEDELLAYGLHRFGMDLKALVAALLPNKTEAQAFNRQKNRSSARVPNNAIKEAKRRMLAPLTQHEVAVLQHWLFYYGRQGNRWVLIQRQHLPQRSAAMLPKLWKDAQERQPGLAPRPQPLHLLTPPPGPAHAPLAGPPQTFPAPTGHVHAVVGAMPAATASLGASGAPPFPGNTMASAVANLAVAHPPAMPLFVPQSAAATAATVPAGNTDPAGNTTVPAGNTAGVQQGQQQPTPLPPRKQRRAGGGHRAKAAGKRGRAGAAGGAEPAVVAAAAAEDVTAAGRAVPHSGGSMLPLSFSEAVMWGADGDTSVAAAHMVSGGRCNVAATTELASTCPSQQACQGPESAVMHPPAEAAAGFKHALPLFHPAVTHGWPGVVGVPLPNSINLPAALAQHHYSANSGGHANSGGLANSSGLDHSGGLANGGGLANSGGGLVDSGCLANSGDLANSRDLANSHDELPSTLLDDDSPQPAVSRMAAGAMGVAQPAMAAASAPAAAADAAACATPRRQSAGGLLGGLMDNLRDGQQQQQQCGRGTPTQAVATLRRSRAVPGYTQQQLAAQCAPDGDGELVSPDKPPPAEGPEQEQGLSEWRAAAAATAVSDSAATTSMGGLESLLEAAAQLDSPGGCSRRKGSRSVGGVGGADKDGNTASEVTQPARAASSRVVVAAAESSAVRSPRRGVSHGGGARASKWTPDEDKVLMRTVSKIPPRCCSLDEAACEAMWLALGGEGSRHTAAEVQHRAAWLLDKWLKHRQKGGRRG